MKNTRDDILTTLKRWWGYDSLREGQEQVIDSVLACRDTLALMPTGAGKSLLYQLPTMMSDGLCIVVTPLVALMKDQVDALHRRGISAVAIHSGLSPRSIDIALDNCVYGDQKFLYIAPERIGSDQFMLRLRKMKVALVAVDEAHCISQWGYDFRPSYLQIKRIREVVPSAVVLALTASATAEVAADIMNRLEFGSPNVLRSDFARHNISFAVRRTDDKRGQLLRLIDNVPGSAIVYMRTREGCEKLAAFLSEKGYSAGFYHAGLPHTERSLRQDEWLHDKTRIMVATNAFGMGIDKNDVRAVVHYDVGDSLEAYYQEAGRAGRDQRRSYALLLAGSDEKSKVQNRFDTEFPDIPTVKSCYSALCNRLQVGYGDGAMSAYLFDIYRFAASFHKSVSLVRNALKILAQNGYLALSDDAENPARLMFCVSRDDLYSLRVERADTDGILRTILRLYEGVFTEFRQIDVQEIALYSGYTEEQVGDKLKELWRMHVIRYVPRSFSPIVTLLSERVPDEAVYIDPEVYFGRKQAAARRIESMFEYIDTKECRSLFLQRYFGQTDAVDCGSCDNCIARRKAAESQPASNTDIGERILEIVGRSDNVTVKTLVAEFQTDPDEVLAELDKLCESGEISISRDGFLVKKR